MPQSKNRYKLDLMPSEEELRLAKSAQESQAQGAMTGSAIGTALGAGAGLASFLIPGIGPVIAPIATPALASVGGAAGGTIGSFVGEQFANDAEEKYMDMVGDREEQLSELELRNMRYNALMGL